MPARKMTYQVDVVTSGAVSDLRKLGDAGAQAGEDIADGFDQAESKATSAVKAMSAKLDQLEADAKGASQAVAAISEHLEVDVDSDTLDRFVSNLRTKMGLTFDEITADAKQFADVLERGVDMSRTTSEIRTVGDELDHVRDNGDQSRSVLANMAGNVSQDLGELGGVVGSLGVGIGQLAEYATEGNVSLKGLASVAGPMAALTAASFVIQGISSGLADLKKRQEAYTQQQQDFNAALRETGDLNETVNDMLEENVELSSAPELNWWQGMMDDLPVLTGMVNETETAQSGLVEALAASGTSAEAFTFALDHGLGPFNAMMKSWRDAKASGQITEEQFDLLTTQLDLYSQTALKAEVQQNALNTVFGDAASAAKAYGEAIPDVDTSARLAEEAETLAAAYRDQALAIRDAGQNARDAYAIMQQGDWQAAKVDAATTAMSEYFATADAGLHSIGDLSAAYQGLGEALEAQDGQILPNLTTPEGRATLDALDQLGQALIPDIAQAFQRSHGNIATFKADMQGIYQGTLVGLSNQLGISTGDVEKLLAQIGFTPDHFDTMYELNGIEEAKLKLSLLQTQIDNLPEYVQLQVQQQIILGDYQGALDTVQYAFARGAKVPISADVEPAKQTANQFRHDQESTPIYIPVKTYGVTSGFSKAGSSSRSADTVGVSATATATDTATMAASPFVVQVAAPRVTPTIVVQAAVVGNRYQVDRVVARALRNYDRANGERR